MNLIFSLCSAFLVGSHQEISQVGFNITQKKIWERFYIKHVNIIFFAVAFSVDNEAGNFLGGFIIVSNPKETKLLTCSCSNLLEARPWWFSAFCSPLVLQTPKKPQPVQYFWEKKERKEGKKELYPVIQVLRFQVGCLQCWDGFLTYTVCKEAH